MPRQISRKISLLALAAIAFTAFTAPTHANVVIDSFDVNQSITAPPTTFGFVDGPTSSIIGGQRDATVSRSGGATSVQFESNLNIPGALLFSTNFSASGIAVIQYDGADNSSAFNPTGLGGIDVTQSGVNKGVSITGGADLPGATILFELFTNATQFSSFLFATPVDGSGLTTSFIPFTSFTGTADPTNLGALRVTLTNPTNADVALQLTAFTPPLAIVPEPSALGLVVTAGLSGLFFTRRRRRAG